MASGIHLLARSAAVLLAMNMRAITATITHDTSRVPYSGIM